jgi:hypothetical protein
VQPVVKAGTMSEHTDDALDVLYHGIMPFFLSLPSMNHLVALILSVIVPGALWLTCCACNWYFFNKHEKFSFSSANFIVKRAGIIACLNIIFLALLCSNQTTRFIMNTTIGVDIMYYTKVDLPEYDAYDAVNAASSSSLNSVAAGYNGRRRLGSNSAFTIIYHTSDWSELLSDPDTLANICLTERNIRLQNNCLGTGMLTILGSFFDVWSCKPTGNAVNAVRSMSPEVLATYFEDGINSGSPQSHIIISGTTSGSCHGSEDSVEMAKLLNSYAVGNVQVTYAETSYLQDDFVLAVIDAAFLTIAGIVLSVVFFMFWIRGVVCGFATVFCIVGSIVAAAGTLETWQYGSFSAFNVMAVFILIGIAANAVLLFDAAWRGVVAPGAAVTGSQILVIYGHIGEPTLFTILAACLSLFSKLASPVIVISQLGAFMGTSVVVLYVQFHYVIIPTWIVANRVRFPQCWHNFWNGWKLYFIDIAKYCCGGIVDFCQFGDLQEENSDDILAPDEVWQARHVLDRGPEHKVVNRLGDKKCSTAANNGIIRTHNGEETDAESSSDGVYRHSDPIVPVCNSLSAAVPMKGCGGDDIVRPHDVRYPERLPQRRRTLVTAGALIKQCLGSYYFKVGCRLIMLAASLFSLVVIAYLVSVHYVLDFGIPQLFSPSTNLGGCFIILREYKSSILDYASTTVIPPPDTSPTQFPIMSPNPTADPTLLFTRRPTSKPTEMPTFAPSAIPTAGKRHIVFCSL